MRSLRGSLYHRSLYRHMHSAGYKLNRVTRYSWSFRRILYYCTAQKSGHAHRRSFAILYIIIVTAISVGSLFGPAGKPVTLPGRHVPMGIPGSGVSIVNTNGIAGINTTADSKSIANTTTSGTPRLNLISQSPWVSTSQQFHLTFGLSYTGRSSKAGQSHASASTSSGNPPSSHNPPSLPLTAIQGLQVSVSLYDRLTSQSDFQATLTDISNDSVLATSTAIQLSTLYQGGNSFELSISLNGATSTTAPNIVDFSLPCTPGSSPCHGVYPLQVALQNSSSSSTSPLSTLNTYLTYVHTTPATQPLRVGYIAPLAVPLSLHTSPTSTNVSLQSLKSDISAIKNNSPVPITLQLEPFALQQLACASDINAGICYSSTNRHTSTQASTLARSSLHSLEAISMSPHSEILSGPYVPINIDRLTAASLDNQIHNQLEEGSRILAATHIHSYTDVWLSSSAITNEAAIALRQQGITNIVLGSSNLNYQYTNLTLTNPFTLTLNDNSNVLGYPIDSSSSKILDQINSIGPILSAYDIIANFSMVYFETPYQSTPRGVIAYDSRNSPLPSQFINTLLQLLNGNPILSPVTLSQYMTQVPPSTGPAADRSLLPGSNTAAARGMPTTLRNDIIGSYNNLQAFKSSFRNGSIFNKFYDTFLCSMNVGLSTHSSELELDNLKRDIASYVSNLSLVSDKTITITSSKVTIPITIVSHLHYPVNTLLELSSSGIDAGRTLKQKVMVDHATTVIYVPVTIRATGYFHIEVKLLSMNGRMSLASADLPVRSAAISIVAIILSVGAILILLGWWLHTLHLKRKPDLKRPQHLRTN